MRLGLRSETFPDPVLFGSSSWADGGDGGVGGVGGDGGDGGDRESAGMVGTVGTVGTVGMVGCLCTARSDLRRALSTADFHGRSRLP